MCYAWKRKKIKLEVKSNLEEYENKCTVATPTICFEVAWFI